MLLLFVVVASAAATATTIVATNLAAVVAAADAVADAIATGTIKRAQHYFPALVNWSVLENNLCPFLVSLRRQDVYSCGACAGERPIANVRHRFAAGSARRTAKRNTGKRHLRPLPGPPSPRERDFIFYHSS